ncbi:hypothetical protein OCH239_01605 [Roseivivax halodurans JCM 10272]|uniref:DUF924 domain-containing protein n=1 Tax=Roseivivax halodurans JCM 10272 TaxID=1449350 RepID=X7EN14_9RHOB|nr:DUF924 family protein [Roseivivax halodurans]ETX16548.1 hypothetical protein OCH239_01605 [Roseivivax halodurans JCM 10272]
MAGPQDILSFWLDEVGPEGWYKQDAEIDDAITARFSGLWSEAMEGGHALWLTHASGALAYIVLLDQFSRNMFRGEGRAYSADAVALAAAKQSVHKGWDFRIDEPARQFFYLPLMHSENLCNQDRGVRLIKERMPETGAENLLHAKAHRDVIRRFGRFPHRNEELGRATTAEERRFLDEGGYGRVVRELKEPA